MRLGRYKKGKYDGAYIFEDDDGSRIFIEDPDKNWKLIYMVKKIIKHRRKNKAGISRFY